MNTSTTLTNVRIIIGPIIAVIIYWDFVLAPIIASTLFAIGSITDVLDGRIARRKSQVTKFGTFLDPVADKLMVSVVLISLVYVLNSFYLAIISTIIISREILIISLREWMSKIGKEDYVSVIFVAKLKSIFQMVGIIVLIASHGITSFYIYEIALVILWIGVILSIYSAANYLYSCIPYLRNTD